MYPQCIPWISAPLPPVSADRVLGTPTSIRFLKQFSEIRFQRAVLHRDSDGYWRAVDKQLDEITQRCSQPGACTFTKYVPCPSERPVTYRRTERSCKSMTVMLPHIHQPTPHSWTAWFVQVTSKWWTSTSPHPLRNGDILCKSVLCTRVFIVNTSCSYYNSQIVRTRG